MTAAAILLVFSACKKNDKSLASQTNQLTEAIKIELPKTPEALVRTWEEKISKNDFAFARLISTGNTLTFVNSLAVSNDIEHPADINSQVISIKCAEKGNTALCDCILKDEFGKTAFKYELVSNEGQWMLSDVIPNDEQPTSEQASKKTAKNIQ